MKNKSLTVPKTMQDKYDEIAEIIGSFCEDHLNEEYRLLSFQLCAALCRKRPSPLVTGRATTWACGIVHAIGTVNFLFDPAQRPTMRVKDLCEGFGVSGGIGGTKSKQIRTTMKIGLFDPDWSLPSKVNENPMTWMVSVNGFHMDVRHAPREIQEEAFRRGIIPYLPE